MTLWWAVYNTFPTLTCSCHLLKLNFTLPDICHWQNSWLFFEALNWKWWHICQALHKLSSARSVINKKNSRVVQNQTTYWKFDKLLCPLETKSHIILTLAGTGQLFGKYSAQRVSNVRHRPHSSTYVLQLFTLPFFLSYRSFVCIVQSAERSFSTHVSLITSPTQVKEFWIRLYKLSADSRVSLQLISVLTNQPRCNKHKWNKPPLWSTTGWGFFLKIFKTAYISNDWRIIFQMLFTEIFLSFWPAKSHI